MKEGNWCLTMLVRSTRTGSFLKTNFVPAGSCRKAIDARTLSESSSARSVKGAEKKKKLQKQDHIGKKKFK